MKYTITIPEPCHENWGNMTETAKGKFCGSCKKEVVDFSNISIAMLSKKLDSGSKLCGRFRPDQLNRTIRSGKGSAVRKQGVLVVAVALLAGISPVIAQIPNPIPIAVAPEVTVVGRIAVQHEEKIVPAGKEIVVLTGTVRSEQRFLVGAEVRLKGAQLKTLTDANGRFELLVSASKLGPSSVLQVSAIDCEPREIVVNEIDDPIDIDLFYRGHIMGDIIIEETPNVIDKVKSVFKKRGE